MKKFLFPLLIIVIASLSTNAQSPEAQKPPACGSLATLSKVEHVQKAPEARPEAGKALLVVLQEPMEEHIGSRVSRIGLDGRWVGAVKGYSFAFYQIEGGEHHLCVSLQTTGDPHPLELAHFRATAGETYFYRVLVHTDLEGGMGASSGIELMAADSDHATYQMQRLPLSTASAKKP